VRRSPRIVDARARDAGRAPPSAGRGSRVRRGGTGPPRRSPRRGGRPGTDATPSTCGGSCG